MPVVQYASAGDVNIAYQLFGSGPLNFVIVPGFTTHLHFMWDWPITRTFYDRLGALGRVVAFDKRGTGLSDRESGVPSMDERIEDIAAVMDAADMEEAVLFGFSEGGPMSLVFAAAFPERVRAVAAYGCWPCGTFHPDVPGSEEVHRFCQYMLDNLDGWGQGVGLEFWTEMEMTEEERLASGQRRLSGGSPGVARQLLKMIQSTDIRHVLPTVRTPTLMLGLTRDRIGPAATVRWMAEQIPGARYEEFEGAHLPDQEVLHEILDAVEHFVGSLDDTSVDGDVDRALATVLFTDIVGSTTRATELGDSAWVELLDGHDRLAAEIVQSHEGRAVKSTGDGLLAVFQAPGRAVRAAQELAEAAASMGIEIRAGIHCGEIEKRGDDVAGIAVHLASRVMDRADPGQVLVSRTVTDLVYGSGLTFASAGEHELKGIPAQWELFAPTQP